MSTENHPTTAPATYHERPVEVMQLTEENAHVVADWCGGERHLVVAAGAKKPALKYLKIDSLGQDIVRPGMYVLRTPNGKWITLDTEHFERVFVPAEDPTEAGDAQ